MRRKQGKENLPRLPKGNISDPKTCPCGAATGLRVGAFTYRRRLPNEPFFGSAPTPDNPELPLPKGVQQFIKAFDGRSIPELIAPEKLIA